MNQLSTAVCGFSVKYSENNHIERNSHEFCQQEK